MGVGLVSGCMGVGLVMVRSIESGVATSSAKINVD